MTFDEARLMASVNDRSLRLFEGGYRARWREAAILSVHNPSGTAYRVDTHAGTCDCPFFQNHAGRHCCKHLLGWKRLLSQQRACRRFAALAMLRVWADLDDNSSARGSQKQTVAPDQTFREMEAIDAST